VQHPVQRLGAGAHVGGERLRVPRSGAQVIGHAQLRGGVERLADLEPGEKLDHLDGGRNRVWFGRRLWLGW